MEPPPPPPHGSHQHQGRAGGLPDGKYDIFVIPPSSAGSGFLYLPSLQTHRNSFLAGVACASSAFLLWFTVVPIVREWLTGIISGGGSGVVMLMLGVGVVCWAFGKTQGEGFTAGTTGATSGRPNAGANGSHASGSTGSSQGASAGPPPQPNASGYTQPNPGVPPKTSWQRASATGGNAGAKTSWEKAREETRKKEDERRKAEELKRRRDEAEKARQRDREKEAREKEAREREAREREKQAQDRIERERKEKKEKADREAAEAVAAAAAKEKEEQEKKAAREREREKERAKATTKRPPHASARTETDDDAYSFRPYDRPKKAVPKANSAASIYSDSSYTPSHSTARTTPLPPTRGPYATKDPDKIVIKGVYSFNNAFMRTPVSQLISGQGNVTNGLILRITTEGLFIDDDVRGVPQREWDIKAWTMKLAESGEMMGLHVLRASIRDQEGKKYVFVLDQGESWKVAIGLQRLRRGTQVRALGVSGMPANETKALIENLGWS